MMEILADRALVSVHQHIRKPATKERTLVDRLVCFILSVFF